MAADREHLEQLLDALEGKLAQVLLRLSSDQARWPDLIAGLKLLHEARGRAAPGDAPELPPAAPRLARLVPTAKRAAPRAG